MFVIISVIYRPIEQLLSRSIADRRARGQGEHPLRIAITIQLTFALVFAVVALSLHTTVQKHVFDGSATLYWVLVVGTLAYAASYFARGWLAGHKYFALYGGLVLMESLSRVCFALAVAVGIASGQVRGRVGHRGGAVRVPGGRAGGVRAAGGREQAAGVARQADGAARRADGAVCQRTARCAGRMAWRRRGRSDLPAS